MNKINLTVAFLTAVIAATGTPATAENQRIPLYEMYESKLGARIAWNSDWGIGEGLEEKCPTGYNFPLQLRSPSYYIEVNEKIDWSENAAGRKIKQNDHRRSNPYSGSRRSGFFSARDQWQDEQKPDNSTEQTPNNPGTGPCSHFVDRYLPEMRGLKESLVLDGLNADMSGIDGRFVIQSPGLRYITALNDDNYQVYFTLNFAGCKDNRGLAVPSPFVAEKMASSLHDALSQLRRSMNQSLQQCSFNLTDMRTMALLKGYTFSNHNNSAKFIFDNNDPRLFLTINNYRNDMGTYGDEYSPMYEKDPQRAEQAVKAAQDMINFFTVEYGDKLLDISIQEGTPAEKSELIRAFFQRHDGRVRGWMILIDHNFKDVRLMDKVMIMMKIRAMHKAIRELEDRQQLNSVYMDRVLETIL